MNIDYDEQLRLLSLPTDTFAEGIANLIKFVMDNKKEIPTIDMYGGGSTGEGSLPSESYISSYTSE